MFQSFCFLKNHLLFLCIVILGLVLRHQINNLGEGDANLDILYHLNLTSEAYSNIPASKHYYVPIVTYNETPLSHDLYHCDDLFKDYLKDHPISFLFKFRGLYAKNTPQDAYFSFGAALPSTDDLLVYYSFTSPTFVLPHIIHQTTGIDFFHSVTLAGTLCYIASSILLYCLTINIFQHFTRISYIKTCLYAALGSVCFTFCHESLISLGGVNFWAQSLVQPILILQILLLFNSITAQENESRKRMLRLIFYGVTSLACYVEWSSFLGAIGLAFFLLYRILVAKYYLKDSNSSIRDYSRLLIGLVISTAIGGLLIIIHFLCITEPLTLFLGLSSRFYERSGLTTSFFEYVMLLCHGYIVSYSYFLLFIPIFFYLVRHIQINRIQIRPYYPVIILILALCFENIVLINHSTIYSYDRLKILTPLCIMISFTFYFIKSKKHLFILVGILALASAQNSYFSYELKYRNTVAWAEISSLNKQFIEGIKKRTNNDDSVLSGYTSNVRGYNFCLHHSNLIEKATLKKLIDKLQNEDYSQAVLYEGVNLSNVKDIYLSRSATIIDKEGSTQTITNKQFESEQPSLGSFSIMNVLFPIPISNQ